MDRLCCTPPGFNWTPKRAHTSALHAPGPRTRCTKRRRAHTAQIQPAPACVPCTLLEQTQNRFNKARRRVPPPTAYHAPCRADPDCRRNARRCGPAYHHSVHPLGLQLSAPDHNSTKITAYFAKLGHNAILTQTHQAFHHICKQVRGRGRSRQQSDRCRGRPASAVTPRGPLTDAAI